MNKENITILQEEFEFLKYFLENIIKDDSIQKIIVKIETELYPDDFILNFINSEDIKQYMKILNKYSNEIFDFELGEWYELYIETKKYRHLIDEYFINFYLERIKHFINFKRYILKEK